jgi:hypothetical protein
MTNPFRLLVTAIAAIVSYFFVYWMLFVLLAMLLARQPEPPQWLLLVAFLIAVVSAVAVARSVWRSTGASAPSASRGLARSIFMGAGIVGAIGFAIGFFGPIIVSPGANQGPLLGIFVTGPLGILAGAAGGAIYWRLHHGKQIRNN